MGFLDEIVPEVRQSVGRTDYLAGLPAAPTQPIPSLRRAVEEASAGFALLAEFKRVSPGARDGTRLPVRPAEDFARAAAEGGACAVSCLATRPRFEGSPVDVARIAAVSGLPVLFKDFVVERSQLDAARRSGAAAVLLIARLETEGRIEESLSKWSAAAHDAGLEVLLEFHRRGELKLASRVAADVYGVNVRDLDTLELEPERATETLGAMGHLRPRLVLSGARGPEDARRWRGLGADGLLVGTAFQRAPDSGAFLASLRRGAEVRA